VATFEGKIVRLYDLFVDWEGRLGREMPGLTARLRAHGARRVLDAGCGTGRHVAALLQEGFDAHGADASPEMLAQAREHVGDEERFRLWRMGEPPPEALGTFDALVCLGNTWPQLTEEGDIDRALAAFRELVRPGGLVLLGLKALAIRRKSGNPYLPLLKRERDGETYFFVRFVDFDPGRPDLCEFHMVVVRGDAGSAEPEALVHRAGRARVWSPGALARRFAAAGFGEVHVSARLDDPDVTPTTEDVFVHAVHPA
jgi:SAM-dependent methyltransferase